MSNLPNSKDTFTRVSEKTLQENIHRQLHNSLAETLENVQKYSGTIHVSSLPSSSEVGTVYTLIQVDGEHQPGIYICTDDSPIYMPLASRGEGYVKQYEVNGETTVAIEHNLNSIGVFISAYDSEMNQVEYDELRIVDENNIEIKFSSEFTGTLVLLAGGKDGLSPEHEWDGPKLRFKNPNGSWGEWMDLSNVAPGGPMGPMPDHEWDGFSIRFQQPGGSWGEWINLRGAQGAPGAPGVGEPGPEGPEGPGVVWKGLFSLLNTYQKDDLVKYGRNVYICLVNDTTNILPTVTDNWEMYCEGGQNGSGAGSNIIEMEAGEDISCSFDLLQTLSSGEADLKVGAPISYSKSYSKEVLGFKFNIKKIGNPIGEYTLKVFGETDGLKDAEPIAEWTYDASTIASVYEFETYLFGGLTDLQGIKHFDFSSEAGNESNYLVIKVDEYIDVISSPYPVYVGTDGKVYVSQIAELREKCDGLVKTPVISGETATVTVFGIQDGFQELEVGKDYYLSEELGQITTDISNVKVGKAINYQEILMQDAGLMIRDKDLILQTEQGLGLNTINPDNITPYVEAYLEGGNGFSLKNLSDLGVGSNDGKFSINIDGEQHNDANLDLAPANDQTTEINAMGTIYDNATLRAYSWNTQRYQSFTTTNKSFLKSISINLCKYGSPSGSLFVSIYEANGDEPTGDPIKTVDFGINVSSLPQWTSRTTISVDINLLLEPNKKYVYVLTGNWNISVSNYVYLSYSRYNEYTGGRADNGADYDYLFSMDFKTLNLVSRLQTLIRQLTSKLERIVLLANKLYIYGDGGLLKTIGKMTAPSSGTDISGAGYLDLGANATFHAGDGDDYKLVRLDKNGGLPHGIINIGGNQSTTAKNFDTVYQNTSGKNKLVVLNASINLNASGATGNFYVKIGETSTPATLVANARYTDTGGALTFPITFIIPKDYYYKFEKLSQTYPDNATITISSWFECDLT